MKARKRKENGDGNGGLLGKRDASTHGVGEAHGGDELRAGGDGGHVGRVGTGDIPTAVVAVERGGGDVKVAQGDRTGDQGGSDSSIEVCGDFHLCETPQGERVAYRVNAVVAFRKGPYPGQFIVAVGGSSVTVKQSPRILGSREQAERWVMR